MFVIQARFYHLCQCHNYLLFPISYSAAVGGRTAPGDVPARLPRDPQGCGRLPGRGGLRLCGRLPPLPHLLPGGRLGWGLRLDSRPRVHADHELEGGRGGLRGEK